MVDESIENLVHVELGNRSAFMQGMKGDRPIIECCMPLKKDDFLSSLFDFDKFNPERLTMFYDLKRSDHITPQVQYVVGLGLFLSMNKMHEFNPYISAIMKPEGWKEYCHGITGFEEISISPDYSYHPDNPNIRSGYHLRFAVSLVRLGIIITDSEVPSSFSEYQSFKRGFLDKFGNQIFEDNTQRQKEAYQLGLKVLRAYTIPKVFCQDISDLNKYSYNGTLGLLAPKKIDQIV